MRNYTFRLAPVAVLIVCSFVGCPSDEAQRDEVQREEAEPAPSAATSPTQDDAVQPVSFQADEDAPEDGYGHLQGRFVLSGAPKPAKITVSQDAQFCGTFGLVDESIKTSDDGGLANVVIWLLPDKDAGPPQPHPSYEETAGSEVVLDNKECRFSPRILLVRTSQKFKATNSDRVSHNTKIEYDPDPINPNIPPGSSVNHAFGEEQRLPVSVSCSSHPWMQAKLVVRESPYMAVTDDEGNFKIRNLPAGKWTFQFWHEALGYIRKVNVDGEAGEWARGRLDVTIESENAANLGDVHLKMADYAD